jgi:DegV family protein with EDD domain
VKNRIAILTDTNSGLSPEQAKAHGIDMVPMPVVINDETFFEHQSIDQNEFFNRLRQGASVRTSQPTPSMLMEIWDRLLEKNDHIIYLPMSSGLSGSYETACSMAQEYSGRVYPVDNHRISVTLRQSVLEAKYYADLGMRTEEIVQELEKDGLNASIYLAVNTLEYLKRGGRVTPAGAAVGTVLNIKPVLQIQGQRLDAYRKVRGMKAAMSEMIHALKYDRTAKFNGQKIAIRAAYSGDEKLGEAWRAELQTAFPDLLIEKDALSVSISCHTGEGALGVGIMRDIWQQ